MPPPQGAVADFGTDHLGLIRFRGHVPKGGYDVHDAQDDEVPATTPAV